jgi:predicted HTH transcriptional regulator
MATYPQLEGKSIEFKEEPPAFSKLIRTCVAFANTSGGDLIIGVVDKSREIKGLDNNVINKIYEDFPNALYDAVSPTVLPQIYIKNIDDKQVLVIKVWPGNKKPYFIKSMGIPKGVYIRAGASTRPVSEESLEDLVREGQRRSFDQECLEADLSSLSSELLKNFYETPSSRQLLSDGVAIPNPIAPDTLRPTVAGALFFSESPDHLVPEAVVLCTLFKGNLGREIIQSVELKGPIANLVPSTLRQLSSWMERNWKMNEGRLEGASPVPEVAIREAVVNALIHRKYSVPGPVKIALYEHRLEIFSPGHLPGLVSVESLGDGTTFLRNPIVANLARKHKLVEKMGSGIRMIKESCAKASLPPPSFFEGGDYVKVIFEWSKKLQNEENGFPLRHLFDEKGHLTPSRVMQETNDSRRTVSRKLKRWVEEGHLLRHGKGAGIYYTPNL